MKLTFRIHYYTQWGQQMALSGSLSEMGSNVLDKVLLLEYQEEGFWEAVIELENAPATFSYRYLILDSAKGAVTEEWGDLRQIEIEPDAKQLWIRDAWRTHSDDANVFYSSAFVKAIFKPKSFSKVKRLNKPDDHVSIHFQMDTPIVPPGLQLGVIGNIEELGNWNKSTPLLLNNNQHPRWEAAIHFPKYRVGSIEYKYCFYNPSDKKVEVIEGGGNRQLLMQTLFDKDHIIVADQNFTHPKGPWKGAGLAIPVFSIRTEDSLGVGEFNDLKKVVDWAALTGLKMVQILPVNDTIATKTWTDSYPYAAISVFALHPIFLHLDPLFAAIPPALTAKKQALNALVEVDYEKVMATKMRYARMAYDANWESFLKDKKFKQYFKENKDWLEPYAVFSYLRDQNKTVDFSKWGAHAVYSKSILKKLASPKADTYADVAFYYYLQYHLDLQLRAAADYARAKGLVLKGDLPIGIYRHSVDAWVAPRLYNMDGQAGAPPDPFSADGQNWGFPTYNWEEMAKDGYQWWRSRMQQLARYFDAYRIDHILGFFRIWEIPQSQVDGLLGVFNPAIPVNLQELKNKGITFDPKRFCEPYITEAILEETFPQDIDFVRFHFFTKDNQGNIVFKKNYNTQKKIRAFFEKKAMANKKEALLDPLYKLIANVLFIPDKQEPTQHFHPRIDLISTHSFEALPIEHKTAVRAIYYDYFYNRQEAFWKEQAMEKLPAMRKATNMLICGEDLGMVPECVPGVMEDQNILTLEIQRMSKNPNTEFLAANDIPYLSVVSPSTHDMSPIRLWWEESTWEQIQRFYEQELKMIGDHPFYCEPYIAQAIIHQHLSWPSMWAVFPLQDLLAMDGRLRRKDPSEERINVPANPNHYWRYRMHLSIEDLMKEKSFNHMLWAMLSSAKRV
ncbi:MAG: 4-alpha-glucanotransferase [Saprospiraceae bacterium]